MILAKKSKFINDFESDANLSFKEKKLYFIDSISYLMYKICEKNYGKKWEICLYKWGKVEKARDETNVETKERIFSTLRAHIF